MPAPSAGKSRDPLQASFEIKSAQLSLVALLIKTSDWNQLVRELLAQFGPDSDSSDFFENDPLVIDFSAMEATSPWQPLDSLLHALQSCKLRALAARGFPPAWAGPISEYGLVHAPEELRRYSAAATPSPQVKEVIREAAAPATMVVDKPLRSGQKIYARGADLVVLAMVNQGAEIVADGNIHVYAPLRGKAMAGARGNVSARIFSLCLEPELISIAGVYRTSETALPKDINGKPAQVRLSTDGQEKLIIEALKS
jgi:septum site-determining protein MinC